MRSSFTSSSGYSGKVFSQDEKTGTSSEGIFSIEIRKDDNPVLSIIIKTIENERNELYSLWKLSLSEELIKNHVSLMYSFNY